MSFVQKGHKGRSCGHMTYMGIALNVKVMYHQQFLHPHEMPNVCMHVQELILKDKSLTYVYIGKHGLKKGLQFVHFKSHYLSFI